MKHLLQHYIYLLLILEYTFHMHKSCVKSIDFLSDHHNHK